MRVPLLSRLTIFVPPPTNSLPAACLFTPFFTFDRLIKIRFAETDLLEQFPDQVRASSFSNMMK